MGDPEAEQKELELQDIKDAIQKITSWGENNDYERSTAAKTLPKLLKAAKPDDWQDWLDFVVISIRSGWDFPLQQALMVIQKKKLLDWKDKKQNVGDVIVTEFESISDIEIQEDDESSMTSFFYLGNLAKTVINLLKSSKQIEAYWPRFMNILKLMVKYPRTRGCGIATTIGGMYPWKTNIPSAIDLLNAVHAWVLEYGEEITNKSKMCTTVYMIVRNMCIQIRDSTAADELSPTIAKLLNHCKDCEFIDFESGEHTVCHEIVKTILEDLLFLNTGRSKVVQPMIEDVKDIWESCDDELLKQSADNVMQNVGGTVKLEDDIVNTLIDKFVIEKDVTSVMRIVSMYEQQKDVIFERLDEILDTSSNDMPEWVSISVFTLLDNMAKNEPERMSEKSVKTLANSFAIGGNAANVAAQPLKLLADVRPDMILPYDDLIITNLDTNSMLACHIPAIMAHLAHADKSKSAPYMKRLFGAIDKHAEMYQVGIMYAMQTIGAQHPELLQGHEALFERLGKEPTLKTYCDQCLDIIAGRSLKGVQEKVSEQQEDIDTLDTKVLEAEERTDVLEDKVQDQDEQIEQVQHGVMVVEAKVDVLDEEVEETKEKVEELDHKTLSHAPVWSREVATLLNVEAQNDWRLLASRLAYTNDDIRNWATQPDPCLSMLDEWFATHKTREGTYAVMKMLVEINQIEAAEIVEKALQDVENIIEDEEEDVEDPPEVFISYQWSHQPEVKLLKKHLEMAGFKSWMDVGQMGGGDKLYSKIDAGIRAAKIIICCVTTKYAQSPNCNKEVNLAVTLGKPIIPLLMENLHWPPAGAMGPIFGEYLYIRFFQHDSELLEGQPFWNEAKLQELLMQIRYSVVPDPDIITEEYREWWNPEEEEIVIQPRKHEANQITNGDKKEQEEEESPEVFISYQWGKQKQVAKLYKRLTAMGYTCWMDIKMMGGGDSLYDKIDKGVRGCKIVLSCVTKKYALSANCRREVSLSDALKRPIIPLLLDDMTWPPEGPMGMVFTQLLYINFNQPSVDIQDNWLCPQFDELIRQMKLHVPDQDSVLQDMMDEIESSEKELIDPIQELNQQERAVEYLPKKTQTKAASTIDGKQDGKVKRPKSSTKATSKETSAACNIL